MMSYLWLIHYVIRLVLMGTVVLYEYYSRGLFLQKYGIHCVNSGVVRTLYTDSRDLV